MGWYVLKNRRHVGPYTKDDLATLLRRGHLLAHDYVISDVDVAQGELKYQALQDVLPSSVKAHTASAQAGSAQADDEASENRPLGTFSEEELQSNEMSRVFSEAIESIDLVKGASRQAEASNVNVDQAFPRATVFVEENFLSKLRVPWFAVGFSLVAVVLGFAFWKFDMGQAYKRFSRSGSNSSQRASAGHAENSNESLVVSKTPRPVEVHPRAPASLIVPRSDTLPNVSPHRNEAHTIRVPKIRKAQDAPIPAPPTQAYVPPPASPPQADDRAARDPSSYSNEDPSAAYPRDPRDMRDPRDPNEGGYNDEYGSEDRGDPSGPMPGSRAKNNRRSIASPAGGGRDPDAYYDEGDSGAYGAPYPGDPQGDEQPMQDAEPIR
jgi:hypothetical protein